MGPVKPVTLSYTARPPCVRPATTVHRPAVWLCLLSASPLSVRDTVSQQGSGAAGGGGEGESGGNGGEGGGEGGEGGDEKGSCGKPVDTMSLRRCELQASYKLQVGRSYK